MHCPILTISSLTCVKHSDTSNQNTYTNGTILTIANNLFSVVMELRPLLYGDMDSARTWRPMQSEI